ncbi:MAG: ketose-bisphosphate aldolase [Endomicrobium sp.]|jgi:fructose-bisphosphate aldolase class II|nr:ketose-bisphosphate aldolase [Endomicrobium sp.]
MALVPCKEILNEAMKKGYGVGAYNVNNMEQIQAVMMAAKMTQSPVIIQASRGALKYFDLTYFKYLVKAAVIENPDIPIAIHLDHGNSLELILKALNIGFTSVMIDGSLMEDGKTVSTYEYNVKVTRSVVEYAHSLGVSVEGEIGTLGGLEDNNMGSGSIYITDPQEAKNFVNDTNVDFLAIAIGTSHGAYKFKNVANIDFNTLKKIRSLIDIPIVLHGASSISKDLIYEVNKYGGKVFGTSGMPISLLQKAIKFGVSKINIDTDGRLAVTAAIRKFLIENPEKFDPRDYLGYARTVLSDLIASKMKAFGTLGHANDYVVGK